MKISNLIEDMGFRLLNDVMVEDKEVEGLNCCDLLSWVMANGKENDAWITVQTHSNILAVASLLDMSCVIIPEAIKVEEETLNKANEQGVVILGTELGSYDIFKKFYEAGLR